MARRTRVVGIDVSMDKADCAVHPTGESRTISNDQSGFAELIAWLLPQGIRKIVMEATGGREKRLARALRQARYKVEVVNPWRVRHYALASGRWAKNDKIDASVIAAFGASFDSPVTPPDLLRDELAEHVSYRRQLVEEKPGSRTSKAR